MQGDDKGEGRGVIQRCCEELLKAVQHQQRTGESAATLHIGILELYLDRLRDLGRLAVELLADPAFSPDAGGGTIVFICA